MMHEEYNDHPNEEREAFLRELGALAKAATIAQRTAKRISALLSISSDEVCLAIDGIFEAYEAFYSLGYDLAAAAGETQAFEKMFVDAGGVL